MNDKQQSKSLNLNKMKNIELQQRFTAVKTQAGYVISYENAAKKWSMHTPYFEDFDLVDNITELSTDQLIELRKRIVKRQERYAQYSTSLKA